MSTDIVATSQNIENITSMLTKLENIKDDSSKLRGISLDNTGWEGMDASSFNTALSNFCVKLDKTTDDIEEALKEYKSKQEEQLELLFSAESKAKTLIEGGDEKTKQDELYNLLKAYDDTKLDISRKSLSQPSDSGVLRDILKEGMNKYPGNNITDEQVNEIINEYGKDGFNKEESIEIWDKYFAKG